jgi:hypothetical protein
MKKNENLKSLVTINDMFMSPLIDDFNLAVIISKASGYDDKEILSHLRALYYTNRVINKEEKSISEFFVIYTMHAIKRYHTTVFQPHDENSRKLLDLEPIIQP